MIGITGIKIRERYNDDEFFTVDGEQFHEQPPGMKKRVCDACMKDVLGFVYHCNGSGRDLHPCCANLPQVLDCKEHKLYLYHKLSRSCDKCGKKGSGLSYRSECKKYNYHVSCVKSWFMESWEANESQKKEEIIKENKKEVRELEIMKIPKHKGTLQRNDERKSTGGNKVWKVCKKIATAAVGIIVAAILGDPTAMIVAVVGAFMPK
ncbi:uncharacterized protein LOC122073771 [Macadamia integrifolia]|uniref:uncharacterized protein LOC122073771 n=1 Tax=Macadamia integrifolia TaxID=60698 RepID=UPI001C4F1EA4|nr:uncharacterized protein LOC122073771 [Macadamia integrifolia]